MRFYFFIRYNSKVIAMACTGCAKRRQWLKEKKDELERIARAASMRLRKVTSTTGEVTRTEYDSDSTERTER